MHAHSRIRSLVWTFGFVVLGLLHASLASAAADQKAEAGKTPPAGAAAPIEDVVAHIEKQLASKTELQYLDTTLGDVVGDLELRHKIDIQVDKDALTSEGKSLETVFNLQLRDVSLQSALNQLLKEHGLTWLVTDEVILITTKADAATRTSVNVYSVADLGDGDGNIDYDELTEMLTQSVDHESWRTNGGPAGTIAKLSAKKALVITQTYANHRIIAALLKSLAEK